MKRRPIPWNLLLLGVVASLCLLACKDPDGPKPDEKFYCKVNGKDWRPNNDGDFKRHALISDFMDQGKTLYLRATDAKKNQTVSIFLYDSLGIDTVIVGRSYEISLTEKYANRPPAGYFYKPESKGSVRDIEYTTSDIYKGTFRILSVEHDRRVPTSFKMRAEFEFTAVNPSGEVVKITEGRFNDWVRIKQ